MDVKSLHGIFFYMASKGSCFMTTWIIFKNHLLEEGLTQNQETTTLWTLTIIRLFYFIMCENPTWIESPWNDTWLRARSHMTSHYTWGSVVTLHDVGGCVGMAFEHFLLGSHTSMVTALGSCVKSGPKSRCVGSSMPPWPHSFLPFLRLVGPFHTEK